jgi:hypothetical protein
MRATIRNVRWMHVGIAWMKKAPARGIVHECGRRG